MITDPQGTVLALFVAFCRIGGCVMVMPGFASARVPPFIRLLAALAVSMAILPLLWDTIYPRVSAAGTGYIILVITETFIGTMFGLIARLYTLGLQFAGSAIAMMIGFTAPGSSDIIEDAPENQLTNLLTFAGLMLLFALDFHHVIFTALVDSYTAIPIGDIVSPQKALITLTDTLVATFYIMLRLASPFILFGLMFNISIGMINKLAPQIPIYFISTPYLLMGGLFMLYLSIAVLVQQFAEAFTTIYVGR